MVSQIWDEVHTVFSWMMSNLLIINIFLSIVIIFFQRREPKTVWTWLLILYFIPILGFVLYLLIGQDYRKNKMFKTKEIEGEMKYAVLRQAEIIQNNNLRLSNSEMERFQTLMIYNLEEAQAVLTDNNDIRIYTDGNEKFDALMMEMEHARKYIHLQYYIIKDDELWQRIREVLIRKAHQGVEVRVLFDGMGCRRMHHSEWKALRKEGIETAEFFPAFLRAFHLRINYRNHRKIVVIDGRIGFLGGYNIGREYIGLNQRFGYWRDTHMCIEGAAVTSLAIRFVLDWNYAAKEDLFLEDRLFTIPNYIRGGTDPVQIITSGPDSRSEQIKDNYARMVHEARDHVYVQSPYFIPDEVMLDALCVAARSGVDVRIMVPCKPDHPFVYWATYSYLGDLIAAGARCYVYNNGFLHAKMMTVDGLVTCCGTANMDIRSFRLNFEVNATIYSAKTAAKFERIFENDITHSTLITRRMYGERGLKIRAKEQFSRLLSPLL